MRNPQIHTAIEDRERFCVVCGTVKIAKRHGTIANRGNRGSCLPKLSLLHFSPVSCRVTLWTALVFCVFNGLPKDVDVTRYIEAVKTFRHKLYGEFGEYVWGHIWTGFYC